MYISRMTLARDQREIRIYDEQDRHAWTISDIPERAFAYQVGNRSALEWVVDQYRVKEDKRSGIVNDPNRADDPQYILRLIGKVIAVSLETVEIVEGLPDLDFLDAVEESMDNAD